MRSLSVVVTGDSEAAEAVRALVMEWTRARITESSLWVRESDLLRSEGQPPQVFAWVVTPDGEQKVDLFAHLGRFRLDRVRVVVAQLAATAEDADPEISALGDLVADLIRQALPRDPSGMDITHLHRTMLLVPATDVTGLDSRILLPAWEANVVVSPEDRPDLDRSSLFVRTSTNFPGHAAAAVSAAAGLIRGVSDGVFDAVSTDSSTRADDVVVARVTIRTVVGDDVLDVLTRRALDPEALAPVGPGQVVTWAIPASDPQLVVERATRAILTTPEWAPSPGVSGEEQAPGRERFTRAFGRAARFSLRTVSAVAAWSFSRGRDMVDRTATEQLVGSGAGAIVTVGPRAVDRMGEVAQGIIEAKQSELAERLTYEATRSAAPAPTTWSTLRELSFALADGGPIEGMDAPRQLGQREVLEPHDVVPQPGAEYRTQTGQVIEATDPRSMRSYLAELEELLAQRRQEATALRVHRDEVERHRPPDAPVPEPAAVAAPTGDDEVSAQDAEEAEEAAPESAPPPPPDTFAESRARWAADLAAAEERLAEAEGRLRDVDEELAAFAEWFEENASSVVWRVGDDVARRLTDCESNRQAYRENRNVTAPATAALDAAKKRLLRRWWVTAGLAVVALVVLALVVREQQSPDWSDVAWWVVGIVGVTLAMLVGFNHAFYKAFRRYEWQVRNLLAQQRAEADQFLWAGKEYARLKVLYRGWQDWTRIIAEVVHRPWQSPQEQVHHLPDEVVDKLPAAMAVARQQDEHADLPPTLLARAYGEVYREGWAQHAFDTAYEELASAAMLTGSTGYLDVDVDASPSEVSPRGQLLELWRSGQARELLTQRQAARLRELVFAGDLSLPLRRVQRIGPHSDREWREEPEYFAATATSETTFALDVFGPVARTQNRHYASQVTVWLPRSARPHAVEDRGSGTVKIQPAEAATSVRVDLSRRIPPQDLAILAPMHEKGGRKALAEDSTEGVDSFL